MRRWTLRGDWKPFTDWADKIINLKRHKLNSLQPLCQFCSLLASLKTLNFNFSFTAALWLCRAETSFSPAGDSALAGRSWGVSPPDGIFRPSSMFFIPPAFVFSLLVKIIATGWRPEQMLQLSCFPSTKKSTDFLTALFILIQRSVTSNKAVKLLSCLCTFEIF